MEEFVGERIEVEQAENAPRPVRFTWRGETHEVAQVVQQWVEVGFGPELPERSRKWFNRRHRRYYLVRDAAGDVYEIYLDYADKRRRTWWMVRKL